MNNQNPILGSVAIVFAFWYGLLFLLAGFEGYWPWEVIYFLPKSLLIAAVGLTCGLGLAIIVGAGRRVAREDELLAGDSLYGASFTMGGAPSLPTLPRRAYPLDKLRQLPWWNAVEQASPQYARAIRAVIDTMNAVPRLPASPYPGGHAGRSLLEHSLAVVPFMLREAGAWVYRGQLDKRGNVRVPLANPDEPHRFAGADAPLLILAAVAHDIGKMACYKPLPQFDASSPSGPMAQVTEVLPKHDTEGARLLRMIPEVMELPIGDRNALLTAVGYYHHPFGIPLSGWVTDRTRSLTELLARADVETGKDEGHSLTAGIAAADDDLEEAQLDPLVPRSAGNAEALRQAEAEDDDDTAHLEGLLAMATGKAAPAPAAAPRVAAEPEANVPMELRLFMDAIRKPGAINGRQPAGRIAWKHGGMVYVMDKMMRTLIQNQGGVNPLWAAEAMAEVGGNAAPYTAALAEQLLARGALVNTWEGQTFGPSRALFKMQSKSGKFVPVLIVHASAIPGAAGIQDADPVKIVGPLWGAHSARNKAASTTDAGEPQDAAAAQYEEAAPAPSTGPVEFESLGGPAPTLPPAVPAAPSAASAFGFDADDLPMDIAELEAAIAGRAEPLDTLEPPPTVAAPAPSVAAAPADDGEDAAAILRDMILDAEFQARFTIERRTKEGVEYALVPLDSDAGRAVTDAVEALRGAGANVSAVRIATLGDTGQPTYVFALS